MTMQSWKPEVQADATDQWYANALRFATKEEAEHSARDLASRWSAVRKWRVIESDDPVSHAVSVDGRVKAVKDDP
jgi:hypothetical protein